MASQPPEEEPSLQVLEADRQLVEYLRRVDFCGPEYRQFCDRLVGYALVRLAGWVASERIFTECAQIGRPVSHARLRWTAEDREDLVYTTVERALKLFYEHALVGAGWRPDGGACLTTYFLGTCVREFPNVFRRWRRTQPEAEHEPLDAADDGGSGADDPADLVATDVDQIEWFCDLPVQEQHVLLDRAERYTVAEIAQRRTLTPRAVRKILERVRRRLRDEGKGTR